ncbi:MULTISPECIES: M48 family metallopeptidase [unclassified Treponema]|uniref:tetratricopeptide repeat protein n=1 Tax=unclassified Treponema TaxID=2638727 RepID=UPI0020A3FD75|nr:MULTISPECIES: hypothetical protein [unclassified Treponema]UTC66370.1 hypothetical protein E4O06_10380 [Treponema sp. OMZ 789]UTC69100.1 hypothetical protein E4O01_10525 [Treponema sp. OMZ 790]UTC71812.1 hypothetical protein E4O02_10615 [Treponema sp. OMZ 791]
MALSIVDQGKKLLGKKKYNDVISLLEPHVLEYRDSFAFHFYLGLSFLHIGDVQGAMVYFTRARQIKPNDSDLLSTYAAMSLRRSITTEAVEYYLQALEHNPNCKLAKKGLDIIRKNNSPEKIGNFVQSGKIKNLYPKPGSEEKKGRIVAIALVLGISIISLTFIVPYIDKTREFSNNDRANLDEFKLDSNERKYAVDMEGSYIYILTQSQILQSYTDAQNYFKAHRDNAAQVEINRLLSSNASFSIKQKSRLLMDYFEEPGFDNIKDVYSYAQVKNEPLLYLDCWVVWKGMPTNIQTGSYTTAFNLLVGYDTKQILEGVVPIFCEFVSKIDSDRPVSVLGKITIKNGTICLKGKGLYQSQKPAEND